MLASPQSEELVENQVAAMHNKLDSYVAGGKSLCVSSSFQTHSIPLLHMLSRWEGSIPVYFLETGYHFPETLQFRDEIVERLDLELRILESDVPKISQRTSSGHLMFAADPDECCRLNKVEPMERALREHDVWVTGVRGDQTTVRAAMQIEEDRGDGILRYNPLVEWSARTIQTYRKQFGLPEHPLDPHGVLSIGCAPCTRLSEDRDGRWMGMTKTECGLHFSPS